MLLRRFMVVSFFMVLFLAHFAAIAQTKKDARVGKTYYTNEQESIKAGVVKEGMSKKAVIMAWGYPPAHKTPSLEDNTWTYWESRMRPVMVYFENDKISKIEQTMAVTGVASVQAGEK